LYDIGKVTARLPSKGEEPIGAHAMCFVGYNLSKKVFLARNSFGTDWGIDGYCFLPFDYVREEVMDSWIFDIDLIN
jgi:C1A family cysteine protease